MFCGSRMNFRNAIFAVTLAACSYSAFAELPICDTEAHIRGNPDWVKVETVHPGEPGYGLPCQVYFTVKLNTTDDLFAYTDRTLDLSDDASFRFVLDLDNFALSPGDVWSFMELSFATDFYSNDVDLHLVEEAGGSGTYAIVVATGDEGDAAFRSISLPASQSSHEMRIYWDDDRGFLTINVGGRWSQASTVVSLRVGGQLKNLQLGVLTELDNPIQDAVIGFRPIDSLGQ